MAIDQMSPGAYDDVQPSGVTVRVKFSLGVCAAILLIASVVIANWATTSFGFIPVGFGQAATAGTIAAGFTMIARDALQDTLGRWAMLVIVGIAAGVSYFVSDPSIATASMVAILASELLDFAVYTPLRTRARFGDNLWIVAVIVSSIVGSVVDTAIFLGIAFGWAAVLPALIGQLVGKGWATIGYVIAGRGIRALLRQSVRAEGC